MTETQVANFDQTTHWNNVAGPTWVELSGMLDRVLAPFVPLLLDAIRPIDGGHVLDVGCGAGAVTLAAARLAGPGGSSLGVDISAPLVDAAEVRARREGVATARFVRADAQTWAFEAESFDAIVSRFGVMFFDDPVAAFSNLRAAAAAQAKLACAVWRSAAENPFMTTAERTAAAVLPDFPARSESGPGQFAFADAAFVQEILAASGWLESEIRPIDVPCSLPRRDLRVYVTRMGPLGAQFPGLDDPTRAEIAARLETAFEPFVRDDMAHFIAACWMVTALA